MDSQQFTRKKTKKSKTNFYYSFLFLPKHKREAIFTFYSFCRHTDDIVDDIDDLDLARKKLDEWRDELEACYNGNPRHPIMKALCETISHFELPKQYFHDLIDGCEMDLGKNRYETFDDLYKYCYHVASVVGLVCIEIFGYRNPEAKDYAVNLGLALQLTNIMRDVGEDARNGRIYLPREELKRFDYPEARLMKEDYSNQFMELMKFQEQRARGYFSKALEYFDKRDSHLLFPAEIMRKIYFRLLDNIVKENYNVFDKRIRVPNPLKLTYALSEWLGTRWRVLLP